LLFGDTTELVIGDPIDPGGEVVDPVDGDAEDNGVEDTVSFWLPVLSPASIPPSNGPPATTRPNKQAVHHARRKAFISTQYITMQMGRSFF
jgi:hypothetical protein